MEEDRESAVLASGSDVAAIIVLYSSKNNLEPG
jgi:hypothetical protein